jgi:hypothetical protein
MRKIGAAEQERRQAESVKRERRFESELREHGVATEDLWHTRGGIAFLVARGFYRLILEKAIPSLSAVASKEWVELACIVYDPDAPNSINDRVCRDLLFEMAIRRDQSWRSDSLVLAFFGVMLRRYLFPKTTYEEQCAERTRKAHDLEDTIRGAWERGVPVAETKDRIVKEGQFASVDALDKFLNRYGK